VAPPHRTGRILVSHLDQDTAQPPHLQGHPPAEVAITGTQRLTLAVLLTASFTLAVDFSILNVALPAIGADIGFSLDHLQWIATSLALCAAGFTLLFGRMADLFGRRRLFLSGMALLGLASLVGGLAQEPALLIVPASRRASPPRWSRRPLCRCSPRRSRRAPAREGARTQWFAHGSRLHHWRHPRWSPRRSAELALGVLHQRRRGDRRPDRCAHRPGREPTEDPPTPGRPRRRHRDPGAVGRRVRV
jgi:hypothetical protein